LPLPPVDCVCLVCGEEFVGQGKRSYCSRQCYHLSRRIGDKEGPRLTCGVCGKQFDDTHVNRRRYCSMICRGLAQRKRVQKTCQECGQLYESKVYCAGQSKFCSQSCRAKYNIRLNPRFFANPNRTTRKTPYEKPGYLKRAGKVRKRDGYRCVKCGKQFIKGDGKLEVHHKVPIRKGGTDDMDNLESLCRPCHRRIDIAMRKTDGLIGVGSAKPPEKVDPATRHRQLMFFLD
jgi:5-methylcytosine-specific restriction endonuclease McrA